MKKRVDMSGAAFAITLAIAVMLVCMVFVGYPRLETLGVALFVSVVVLLMLMALFYAPMSLSLDDKELCVCRSFWGKRIPLSEIREVRAVSKDLPLSRVCGSGGFMGYWGWFRSPCIGKCFAYYGDKSQRFLLMLKDGRNYILGCRDANELAVAVKERVDE